MNTLILNSMRIQHFKGIESLTIEPGGFDMDLLGENGTGKTTVTDAYCWLFTGKDSNGKADFKLKPVDKHSQEIHNLETEVEGSFSFNNKPFTIMKRFREKYTRKTGTASPEFTGHTNDYSIDGVPKKEKEFKAFLDGMFDVETMQLVTNPFFFSSTMAWDKRRGILMDMIGGDLADSDVISSDKSLSGLSLLLDGKTIDDIRETVTAQKKKINKELESIPARVSELQTQVAEARTAPDPKDLKRYQADLDKSNEDLRALRSNETLSEKKVLLSEVKAEIADLKAKASKAGADAQAPILEEISRLSQEKSQISTKIVNLEESIREAENRNRIAKASMDNLRKKWSEEDSKTFNPEKECPYCSQAMPAEKVQAAIDKFNSKKAERLKSITEEGVSLKENVSIRKDEILASQAEIESLTEEVKKIDAAIAESKSKLTDPTPADTEDLEKQVAILESEIGALTNGSMVKEKTAREKIEAAQEKLNSWNKAQAEYAAMEKARARIDELMGQEKALAAEFERLEEQIYMTDKFIVAKVNLLEDKINSMFKLARFKMFEPLINGRVKECCEVLIGGVPYNHGLNSAARVNAGIDICQTLSEHFGLRAPIWIDNRESVNVLHATDAQVIGLVVSKDPELTVVNEEVREAS